MKATREASTEKAYLKRAEQLWARFGRSGQEVSLIGFIGWLEKECSGLKPASIRQYKASVSFWLEASGHTEMAEAVKGFSQDGNVRMLPVRTSASKLKRFSESDRKAVDQQLRAQRRSHALFAADWLHVAYLAGLRPAEVPKTILNLRGNEATLTVTNAKATNGRAHGEVRTITLQGLTAEDRSVLIRFFGVVRVKLQQGADWAKLQDASRKVLSRAVRRAGIRTSKGKVPSLYSARHQFAADLKKDDHPPEAIAALMGHAVSTTATEHYGRRRHGQGRGPVVAKPEEVQRVLIRGLGETGPVIGVAAPAEVAPSQVPDDGPALNSGS